MSPEPVPAVGARFLTPQTTRIFIGPLRSVHCVIGETEAYANVYARLCFPVSRPGSHVAISYTDEEGKEQQIGIIEDPAAFPEEVRAIVRRSLGQQYYERTIRRVHSVKWQYGLLFLDVDTDQGRIRFAMRWQYEKAIEYGQDGRVLLDVDENRYVIQSLAALPGTDRDRLQRFIYW